jgi:ubiquinone/menaquinone biosynthesis C-methylase UbiE
MDVKQAYNIWAEQYDTSMNKTRDLEAVSLRACLVELDFDNCLEIGCGTGKNTEYLAAKAKQVTAVDLSDEMLAKARQKIFASNVEFVQADILGDWTFAHKQFDLVTFSLVLEHIDNLDEIFRKVSGVTGTGDYVYVGELHPFRQYTGSKARFDTDNGQQVVTCFDHHISDFLISATKSGFEVVHIREYFDADDRKTIPRIISFLFRKK